MDELEVKPHYKTLTFKDTWNPDKILFFFSLWDMVKCGVLGGKGGRGQFLSLR